MNRRYSGLSALEIVLACAAYFVGLWGLGPHVHTLGVKVAFCVLAFLGALYVLWISPLVIHHDAPDVRGWGGTFSKARMYARLRPYGALTLVLAVVLLGIALARDPHVFRRVVWRSVLVRFLAYLPSAAVQALFVFGFLMTRIREVLAVIPDSWTQKGRMRRPLAVLFTASLFSSLHVPNGALMAFAFGAGIVWAWLFYARPSIALLTLSHATLGTIVHRFVELPTRVGPFFGHKDMHFMRALVPGAKELIGNLY